MLQQGCLKVQAGAQPQPIRRNAWMLEIGEASYKIYTDYIQNVIDTDSCPRADGQDLIAIQNRMISGLMALEIAGFPAKLEF
jgi:hypothetical protein